MKNYYEILEVDKKASSEVIEKAYKALVRKYHPDLQTGELRTKFAEKMKDINEAYEVLSNDYKRTTYDEQLRNSTISKTDYEKVMRENDILRKKLVNNQNNSQRFQDTRAEEVRFQDSSNTIVNMGRVLGSQIKSYIKQQKQQTKTIQSKKHELKLEAKDYKIIAIYLIIIILVCIIIYQIPIVKNYFSQLYEKNVIFKAIIDVFINTFKSGF